tara:strand:+ start:125 stop:706 length:582 start_codon:yes stop_codon:yes gene_type:complete
MSITPREVFSLTDSIKRRVSNLVELAVVKLANESTKLRELQLILAGEATPDDYQHFEPFGFSSSPLAGSEALVLNLGGDKTTPLVLCVADRRYRLALEAGEVMIYDDGGAFIKLSKNGIVLQPKTGNPIELGAGAAKAVGRVGDSVEVTIPAASFITSVTGGSGAPAVGVPNAAPITLNGTITAGSSVVKAVD